MHARAGSCLLVVLALACGRPSGTATPAGPTPPSAPARAPAGRPADAEGATPLPIDPRIRVGSLDNGLRYYILPNPKPEKRAQLWLAVNAGSLQEDDDQQGLAHFLEHMAFNGTRKYQGQALIDYLEHIGMQFGPDVNAYTSFDETVYTLAVPTDDSEIVDKGLDILHEWATGIALDPKEVDKERGVVLEEWRLGRGALERIFDKEIDVLYGGSRYAKRLPIGKPETIKGAPRDALARFYQDWYRPDLMAVVAVGDFEAADIERRIRSSFADLRGPAHPRARTSAEVPSHDGTRYSIEADPELTATQVTIYDKVPHRSETSALDYRRSIGEQLYHGMLGDRLEQLREKPGSPFVQAWSTDGSMVRATDAFMRGAEVKDGQVHRALATLYEEVVRIERHGFTHTELERAKKNLLRYYRQSVKERSKLESDALAEEIVRNFLEHEMMPGIEAELALVEKYLPTFQLEEMNQLAKRWSGPNNRVITVSGPSGWKEAPTVASLSKTLAGVEARRIHPWVERSPLGPLMARKPTPGQIRAERSIAELGVQVWTLSNGATVVLKPTTFKNDDVQMQAFSPGGHSLVALEDLHSAQAAAEIVVAGGLGRFSRIQLGKQLSGKMVAVTPYVEELEEGLDAQASADDIETMLQLVHLYFTAPRRDDKAFAAWMERQVEEVRHRLLDPDTFFFDEMLRVATRNHPRYRPPTLERLKQIDEERALSIYADRFADASDFTFVLVGNLDPGTLRPLVEQYLASLPAHGRKERWKDSGVEPPHGVKSYEVVRGLEPKSTVHLHFHGKQAWSRDADNDMRMLGEALDIRLREVLREDMGGVYFSYSGGSLTRIPKERRDFTIEFGCAPENVDKLRAAVMKEIAALQAKGIGASYVDKIRQARRRQHEIDLEDNGFWLSKLATAFRYGDDPRVILDFEADVAKVSSQRIQRAARKMLSPKDYILGVLRPQTP